MIAFAISLALLAAVSFASDMPLPFTRELSNQSPMLFGEDVSIAQNLLIRDSAVDPNLDCDGYYGSQSNTATRSFQEWHGLPVTGTFDSVTADMLLHLHSNDDYKDTGFTAASMGYLYKLYIPVHYNRSIGRSCSDLIAPSFRWHLFCMYNYVCLCCVLLFV